MAAVTTREARLRHQLLGDRPALTPAQVRWGWFGPLLIAALGGFLRFWHLERPGKLSFDETYYVKEGWSLIRFGTEMRIRAGIDKPDELWNAGDTDVFDPALGNIVVHPPVGKWMIGAGEWLLGADDPVGWRVTVALLGTLSILVVGRVALRLFGSVTLAAVAALLIALEGLHLTMSRTALLDMVLMFWVLVGFAALLVDRDRSRELLARRLAARPEDEQPDRGPWLGWRPWRWVAGVALALATSTKWSGLFFVAVLGIMTVLWDLGARRAAGVRHWGRAAILGDGPYAAVQLVVVTAVLYPLTWLGWFRSEHGYLRDWAATHPGEGLTWLPESLRSFVKYHEDMWAFNTTLTTPHGYASKPWTWLLQWRPTSFFYESSHRGDPGCAVDSCSQAVHSIGTVTFWWVGIVALLVVAWHWVVRRDWRAGAIAAGVLAGYGPWFIWHERTTFAFYAVVFAPYVALAITFGIGLVLRPALTGASPPVEARLRLAVVAAYLVLGVLVFAYFYPIHTAEVIPYSQWWARIRWLPGWL